MTNLAFSFRTNCMILTLQILDHEDNMMMRPFAMVL